MKKTWSNANIFWWNILDWSGRRHHYLWLGFSKNEHLLHSKPAVNFAPGRQVAPKRKMVLAGWTEQETAFGTWIWRNAHPEACHFSITWGKMAVDGEQQQAHRAGIHKQKNKQHKHGKHRTKGEIERENKGAWLAGLEGNDMTAPHLFMETAVRSRHVLPNHL